MPTYLDVLSAAAVLINQESKWCKRAAARKADGLPCSPLSPLATRWDLHGSIIKATNNLNAGNGPLHQAYLHLRGKIPPEYKNKDIDAFNDSLTYAQIAALFT